jgi:CDP-diacylglycerol--glycerol-3-phosphate 3-phosphatidyltransferase
MTHLSAMQEKFVTLPTILSFSRVFLLIPILYCLLTEFPNNRLWAAGLIVVGVLTDFWDGYIARTFRQVSELGKVIDPLADKIGVAGLAAALVWLGDIPLWFVIVIVVRDVLIVLGGLYIKKKKDMIPQSNWPGKIAVTLVAGVLLLATLRIEQLAIVQEGLIGASLVFMMFSLGLYAQRLFIGRHVAKGVK